jgi:EmrB/QacA subfamily drug resistance transporter
MNEPTDHQSTVITDPRKRSLVLAAMCIALIAVVASVSGLNVAQGHMATELGASQKDLLWIINGYTIALAALLLPIGAIGDRYGRRWILLGGLGLFLAASLGAALVSSVGVLIGLRVLAGVGAAMIMPVTLSVITSSFAGEERERAIGIWAGFAGAGGILGLVVSSFIVDHFTWQWVFALPLVTGGIALALAAIAVPQSREQAHGSFDTLGSILSAVAVGAFVLGVHEGPEEGWTAPITVIGLVVGIAAGIAFVLLELRREHPLLNVRVFKNRTLAGGSFALLSVFGLMGALFLVLIQFMQAALGYTAMRSAVSLLPLALIMMPLSSAAPLIAKRVGTRVMLAGGALLLGTGLALMAIMASISGGYWSILPGLLVMSVGIGLAMTPGTTAITGSLPVEEQGVASALNDTVRELGTAVGVALIGSMMSSGYASSVAKAANALPGASAGEIHLAKEGIAQGLGVAAARGDAGFAVAVRDAFVNGWTGAMWLSAGLAFATAVFAAVWIPGRKDETLYSHTDDVVAEPVAVS